MKRKVLAIVMTIMMLLVGGCGNKEIESTTDTSEKSSLMESEVYSSLNPSTETVESSVEVKQEEVAVEPEIIDVNTLITEKTDEELNLKKYTGSYEDRAMDEIGEKVFNLELFEPASEETGLITVIGNIDIYNMNGIRIGYVIPKARFDIFGEYDGWYYFYLDENIRFARAEDVDANIKTNEQIKKEEKITQEEMTKHEQPTVNTETSVDDVPVEQPVASPVETPVGTNTYTAEQAVADYRAIMESNGITWDPSIKEFASWGTGMLPLNKAEVEEAASLSLESFAMGDSGGHPWTKYYMEVTGSDENYVYYTKYVCD